jgi:hypothetical protein
MVTRRDPVDLDATALAQTIFDSVEPCHYCGMPAGSEDHLVSQTIAGQLGSLDYRLVQRLARRMNGVVTVPACRECNSILGPGYDGSFALRKARLKRALRKRYAKLIAIPDALWTDDRLNELKGDLRAYVRAEMKKRDAVLARIAW